MYMNVYVYRILNEELSITVTQLRHKRMKREWRLHRKGKWTLFVERKLCNSIKLIPEIWVIPGSSFILIQGQIQRGWIRQKEGWPDGFGPAVFNRYLCGFVNILNSGSVAFFVWFFSSSLFYVENIHYH